MNKIKWTFMALAIILSVGGAMATRPHHAKIDTLYFYNGTAYIPAGELGTDYICQSSANVCTYAFNGITYTPYMQGNYDNVQFQATKVKENKK
ncbi:MAG TPA: DUF6520 family protein [Puia sp.]|jgi:hypothetical protein